MRADHPWKRKASVKPGQCIRGGFDIGFDDRIPEETRQEIRRYVRWLEANFSFPVTLWVDFEYRYYLRLRSGKQAGYIFYWADAEAGSVFDEPEDIPQIRLPVRREHSTMEEILLSFTEAVDDYFAWLHHEMKEGRGADTQAAEAVLEAYKREKGGL